MDGVYIGGAPLRPPCLLRFFFFPSHVHIIIVPILLVVIALVGAPVPPPRVVVQQSPRVSHERPRGNRRIIALVRQHGGGAGGGFRGPRRARHKLKAEAPAERDVAIAGGGRRGGDGGGSRCASGSGGASGGNVPNECPTSLRSAPRSRARPLPRQHVQHAPDRRVKAGDERAGVPPLPATPNHR